MTKPVEPVSPAQKVGDGKSFLERMERGMKNSDPETKRLFAEKLEKYVNEGKVLNEARNEHKKVPGLSRAGGGGGASGGGGDFSGMKGLDKPFKKGGNVSTSTNKSLEKAGFYDKEKTKSEREKIVSKVTTKPQRIGMVEKLFSAKKMKSGGAVSSASKRADGCAIKGKTRA